MKKWSYFLLFLLLSTQLTWADDLADVSQFAKKNIQAVIQLLRDKKTDKITRNKKIIAMVVPLFDFDLMAKLSLGKTYWQQLSEKQQKNLLNCLFNAFRNLTWKNSNFIPMKMWSIKTPN